MDSVHRSSLSLHSTLFCLAGDLDSPWSGKRGSQWQPRWVHSGSSGIRDPTPLPDPCSKQPGVLSAVGLMGQRGLRLGGTEERRRGHTATSWEIMARGTSRVELVVPRTGAMLAGNQRRPLHPLGTGQAGCLLPRPSLILLRLPCSSGCSPRDAEGRPSRALSETQ